MEMLSKFSNEVLSHGPDAVLPQNLSKKWFAKLKEMAEHFISYNYDVEECSRPEDIANTILSVCVLELLRSKSNDKTDLSTEEMLEKITIYSLSLIIEEVNRASDIEEEPPTLENILLWDRIVGMRMASPEFVKTLEQASIFK